MFPFPKAFIGGMALGLVLTLSAAPVSAAPADKLLPADADMVVHLDVKALIDSAVIKKHALDDVKNFINSNEQVKSMLSLVNFDPLKDVATVTLGIAITGNIQQPDVLAIIRGNYDVQKLNDAIATAGEKVTSSDYSGVKVYEAKGGERSGYVAFLDKSTLVGGSTKSLVESAIDQSKGKKEGKLKKETAMSVERADASATIWAAGAIPGSLKELAKASPQGEVVDKIEGLTIGVSVKDGVVTEIAIHTTEAKVAEDMKTQVEQGLQLATALVLQNEQVGPIASDIIGGIKVSTKDKKLILSSNVTAEMIDKAVKKAKEGK